MHNLPKCFFGWTATILFMTALPVFFLVFSVVYNPFGITEFLDMGKGQFALNISILLAIMLAAEGGMRTALHYFKDAKRFTAAHYVCWCLGELIVISLFSSLYLSLVSGGLYPYFDALFSYCLPYSALILIYPCLILSLAFGIAGAKEAVSGKEVEDSGLIRFYDSYRKPKLLIAVSAILYIKADENYMNIWYSDNGKAVRYSLRAPMNSIEESCVRHGLVRCQRSYFVNPQHVTILRKENGWIYADLDMEGLPSIPVSKRYYETLSGML